MTESGCVVLCNKIFVLLLLVTAFFFFFMCQSHDSWTEIEHFPQPTLSGQSRLIALTPSTFDESRDLGFICFVRD